MLLYISEDWTGPINYYRNLPFSRVSEESSPVAVPCLLLTGNKDQFVNLESVVKSTEYVQNFSLKIVEGAGHFPHQELPDTVNNMLLTFLIGKFRLLMILCEHFHFYVSVGVVINLLPFSVQSYFPICGINVIAIFACIIYVP